MRAAATPDSTASLSPADEFPIKNAYASNYAEDGLVYFRLTRLSHLEGLFDYFRLETGVKLNGCNGGISEPVAVKTYPL
jgi:hypothetical protein